MQYDEKNTYRLPLPGTRILDSNDNIYQHGIAIGAYVQGIRIGVWVVVIHRYCLGRKTNQPSKVCQFPE